MFYVHRNARGKLQQVQATPYEGYTEELPADHAEIQEWFSDDQLQNGLKQLKQSDLDMIRVLEDLIEVLTTKGVIHLSDLPQGAQTKLNQRKKARKALGSLTDLIEEDADTGLI